VTVAATGPEVLPTVRVVVLNWNAAWLTARCLRSLQATDYPAERIEIVVVDNASIDGSLERLRYEFGDLQFIANDENLGFAEGNNRALRDLEHCEFVALVNNDAVVDAGWLRPLVAALQQRPRAGAAAPKMLLETPFVEVPLTGNGEVTAVAVDGIDVTRRCLYRGMAERPHPTLPLGIVREVRGAGTVHVPIAAGATPSTINIEFGSDTITIPVDAFTRRDVRINSLGTGLERWTEASERWFGEVDRPHLAAHDCWGFSGGGVLLRSAMLREVGVFDPTFFAYYEDTDLAWRSHRHGWTVVCVPDSIVRHLHGGSAGPEAQGFFFLNYRNWLLTVLRNGSPTQLLRAAELLRGLSWPSFRANVFGRLRRAKRPDAAITIAWLRVLVGAIALAPQVLRGRRRGATVGAEPAADVMSWLMPSTPPRAPRPRVGGPVLCYVDVTETLRSGWRAGIQRVVCELFRTIPEAHHDLEMVPVCWSKVHQQFRRLDPAEYTSMLAPTAGQQPAVPLPPPTAARRMLAKLMHSSGVAPIVYRWRRHKELAAVPAHHRSLLLDRFEPGSVFLDLDATWNPTTALRSGLLPDLRAGGVRTAALQYDLFPHTHPQWFIPQMVDVFMAHLDAHLDAESLFLCISEHTRAELAAYATDRGLDNVATAVIPMGVTAITPITPFLPVTDVDAPSGSTVAPFFLTVGTVEPRKNHSTILDAFAKLRADHPEVALVVVGRPGWNNAEVIDRLRSGPDGVTWRTEVSDAELAELYRTARAVVIASVTEGFGLPVIEALQRGVPVLSSSGGSLPEAGGELVEYFDPAAPDELRRLLELHLDDDHHRARRTIAATWAPSGWDVTATVVGDQVIGLVRP